MTRQKLLKSEIVQLFNTTKETLRHYENIGLLSPEIDDNLYRFYDINELNRLRQIIVLRDLGFSTLDMKRILNGGIDKEAYLGMMKDHTRLLDHKISHLIKVRDETNQMIDLMSKDDFSLSFTIHEKHSREYILVNPFEIPVMDSLKTYYDTFSTLIKSEAYSEKTLISIFKYNSLDNFEKEDSRIGIEIDKGMSLSDINNTYETMSLTCGLYLSVFYVFKEGQMNDLKNLKSHVEAYLAANNLTVNSEYVVEIEHPELSILLADHEGLYEMQIKVSVCK